MTRRGDILRRIVSMYVAALTVVLSVAMPLLERADTSRTPVAESEHDPSRCLPSHDHRLCTQVGANLAIPSASQARTVPAGVLLHLAVVTPLAAPAPAHPEANRTRAPPAA